MLLEAFLTLVFLNSEFVEPYTKYADMAVLEFESLLESCQNPSELRQIILMDADFYLPVTLMVDTFEKYLSLNRKDATILRKYADYIDTLIPEWGDYSQTLNKEAEEIEPSGR